LSKKNEPADLAAINEAFIKYAVLIFPDQHLSEDQHLDFARQFGPLETTIALHRKDPSLRLRKEFADVSNLDPANEVWGEDSRVRMFQFGNRLWHTDSSFKHVPARASLLYARSIPSVGGHTEFADERAAYDALPEEIKRRIASLVVEHSIFNSCPARLFRFQRRGAPRDAAGSPGAGPHRPGIRAQIAVPGLPCGAHLRNARARRASAH
jgi:alpha-ketoglutarate-dependent 2,4-dichlorophenoxyacetate dioxygenase